MIGTWYRVDLDSAEAPFEIKAAALGMASFLDIRTGRGRFTQEQLGRRLNVKDPKKIRRLIRGVVAWGLAKILEIGRKGNTGSLYMVTSPEEGGDHEIEALDSESVGAVYPPLNEDGDQAPEEDRDGVSRGCRRPHSFSSKYQPNKYSSPPPPVPPEGDQGGGGGNSQPLREGRDAWAPVAPPAPEAPMSAPASIDEPGPTPTSPEDLCAATEALDRIAVIWGLGGRIWAPDVLDRLTDACIGGWPAEALALHMANNPPGRIHDPGALLRDRLNRRGLPPGPGACSCGGCERWRRDTDTKHAPTKADRDRAFLTAKGIEACDEHLTETAYFPDGGCVACYEREHPEIAEAEAEAEAFWSRRRPARAGAA